MTIQEAIKEAHACAVDKGFYDPVPSVPKRLALINSELSEALAADRMNRHFKDKKWSGEPVTIEDLPTWKDFKNLYELWIKDTFESELADTCIRIFDLAGHLGIELWIPEAILVEPDIAGNLMEVMEKIGLCNYAYKTKIPTLGESKQRERENISLGLFLSQALGIIFSISEKFNFNLWPFIEAAMKYNRLREPRHGKKY